VPSTEEVLTDCFSVASVDPPWTSDFLGIAFPNEFVGPLHIA